MQMRGKTELHSPTTTIQPCDRNHVCNMLGTTEDLHPSASSTVNSCLLEPGIVTAVKCFYRIIGCTSHKKFVKKSITEIKKMKVSSWCPSDVTPPTFILFIHSWI